KAKILESSAPAPLASDVTMVEDDFVPPVVEEDEPAASADIAMSDPAPSSPAAKVAERRTQPKVEEEVDEFDNDDDDDDEMMEVAHAAAVTVASVNMSASKQVKNVAKPDPVPKSSS